MSEFLARHRKVALDTSVFIFQIEDNLKYVDLTHQLFEWMNTPSARAITSTITMLEVLVRPYRQNDQERVDAFYALLSTYPNLEWVSPGLDIADWAAKLRAEHNLKTPDAIQAATALTSKATGMVTNDASFSKVPKFETLLLNDLLRSSGR